MRLCICDVDNVISENEARRAVARQAYITKYQEQGKEPEPLTYNKGFDWDTFFDPAHVPLDTLIEGAYEAIHALQAQGWHLVYLTSRPKSMMQATLKWLDIHGIACQSDNDSLEWIDVYMKDEENRYTKTPQWKARQVVMLVEMYQASEVLVIDDREDNLAEMVKGLTIPFALYISLVRAVEASQDCTYPYCSHDAPNQCNGGKVTDAIEASQDQAMRYLAGER